MRIAQHETAIDSFHNHVDSGKAHAQRTRILEFIKKSGGDWCIGELANALGMKDNIVSARVNELLYETHDLVERPRRKSRASNITIRPVGLPLVGQLALFQ
ncbi:hypothetical protein [Sideroxydans lithotrophicus]|uniref:Uncharacterized protein n=1 Tax=Sideroxydans lithotrophicus (strain ES-1) TaxID=580332 RepID=D5CT81_SIDLE|nr:hypothetical protein [Sideroxydans lithotrophicus]ADE12167.1 conserved hypothetical protein [Sideroxydans lithotrophicus ES-1]